MTVRAWLSVAVVQLVCLGCSANDASSPSTGGNGSGQGGSAGSASNSGGAAGSSAGGTAGSVAGGTGGAAAGSGGAAGASAGSAGTGGSGGAASTLVTPTQSGSNYTFTYGDVVFEVDPMAGGRIVTFSKAATNLMDDGDGDINYGSTLWPSPQSDWTWPPPAGIDSQPYTAALEGATLVLTGPVDAGFGMSATKRFSVDSGLDRVEIVYSLKNESGAAKSVAPWEITRVAAGGLTFWPAPSAGTLIENFPDPWDATSMVSWYDDAVEVQDGDPQKKGKVNQDGSGWLAHVQGSLLFVKTFPDVQASAFAPGEAEVEIYSNQTLMYVELENQGDYVSLEAGASLTYTVHWYVRAIPETVTVMSGSQTLFDFAAAVPQ